MKCFLITFLFCSSAFAVEPIQVLMGPANANYYNKDGAIEGRSEKNGNLIRFYEHGTYQGKIDLSNNPVLFFNSAGNIVGKAKYQNTNISVFDQNGRLTGRIEAVGKKANFYHNGSFIGHAELSGNIVRFYDKNGGYIGRKQ